MGDRQQVISTGRGRGLRPRGTEDLASAVETQLRLPRNVTQTAPSHKPENLDEILTAIKQLDTTKPTATELDRIMSMANQTVKNESTLKELVQKVHQQSLQNPWFAKNAVQFFKSMSSFEVSGVKLRNVLLNSLKEQFEAREATREQSVESFLNGLEFLGNIFHSMRLANGQPIKLLAIALVKYLETLVGYPIGHSEARILFKQMRLNGKELDELDNAGMEQLLISIRKSIVEERLTTGVKYKLLAIVDLAAGHWALPKQATIDFYNENDVEFDL